MSKCVEFEAGGVLVENKTPLLNHISFRLVVLSDIFRLSHKQTYKNKLHIKKGLCTSVRKLRQWKNKQKLNFDMSTLIGDNFHFKVDVIKSANFPNKSLLIVWRKYLRYTIAKPNHINCAIL